MTLSWEDGGAIFPEFFLMISFFLLILWSLARPQEHSEQDVIRVSTLVFLGAALLVYFSPENGIFFHGSFASNVLTRLLKIGLLLAASGVLLVSTLSSSLKRRFAIEELALLFLSLIGGMVALSANDCLVLFLGFELQAFPIYILIFSQKMLSTSSESALKYFVLGALSTGFFLFGISLVYGTTGTIHFQTLQSIVTLVSHVSGAPVLPGAFFVGFLLILSALAFKMSLVPFHAWAPDVYEGTTLPTALFLASCSKIVVIGVIMRLLLGPLDLLRPLLGSLFVVVAALSMLWGALGGLVQKNFKRLLAYSGISHMGFILCGLLTGGPTSIQAVFSYLIVYIPMVVMSFVLLAILKRGEDGTSFQLLELKGLGHTSPLFAFLLTCLMLSLAGIPPLSGFFAKLSILNVLVENQYTGLAIIGLLSTVTSGVYYLRIIKLLYFEKNEYALSFNLLNGMPFRHILILIGWSIMIIGMWFFFPFIRFPFEG